MPWKEYYGKCKENVVGGKGLLFMTNSTVRFLKSSYDGRLLCESLSLLHAHAHYAQTRIADAISIKNLVCLVRLILFKKRLIACNVAQ